jgi:hypothetical protein
MATYTYIVQNNFDIHSTTTSTCIHQNRLAINDDTLTKNLDIKNWKILLEESLYDHRYIISQVETSMEAPVRKRKGKRMGELRKRFWKVST